ncbi:penicillin-binding protein 1A [Spirulina sp. CS-785/01]|uniref:transglycosylase domain-containing protein n=1 Tax=Spirulina sp. CS-785/01 TaxID=3021716 RepID=UPI00232CEBB7|nr:penicillin-binding protein 1A [Spirulina sp. CS-785/01]MDB9312433.1 penicillin-binding protein 1A [Spirulina sp. CS-785/01]
MATTSTVRQKKGEPEQAQRPLLQFMLGTAKYAGGTILGVTMLTSSVVAGGLVGLAISFRNLPDVRVLRNYVPTETSYIYDIEGKLLDSLHGEHNREVIKLDEISPELKRAVLAIEDSHFYLHEGINPNSVGRALMVNIQSGNVVEGGSTITMQLVKNLFLSRERTVSRKLAEAVLAIRVEQIFTKDQILEMYLNTIYWGHNSYGVETAAQSYFNKSASELSLAEATMMAGLIQAPEDYSPFINYKETKRRQSLVLQRMEEVGWITAQEAEEAKTTPLLLGQPTAWKSSELPYITEAVVGELQRRFGEDALLKGGMRVQTTVDYDFQKMAEENVADAHQKLRSRGLYADQVALVAVDPRTHFVKALVGGVNYKESQFNRAIQSLRQPGSAFKPFVYYTAFASGEYTPGSTVEDTPVRYRDGSAYYEPQNYGGSFAGPMSIRAALIQSRNVPAVKLGQSVGLDNVIEVCRTLGIKSPLDPVISLPLGAIGITPLELAGAYATFASNGWHSDPTIIVRATDSSGNVILDNTPKPRQVLDPWATASLTAVLKGVINEGTATKAQIGRPAAGKTGTTTSERDVWFVGYVPQLSVAVWIGNDNYRPLGAGVTGGGYAAPIWRDFMGEALKDEPVQYFPAASKFPRPSKP